MDYWEYSIGNSAKDCWKYTIGTTKHLELSHIDGGHIN